MKELEKILKLISTKENLKSHLIYKLIRKADLNLLNRNKAVSSTMERGVSSASELDRIYLHACNEEFFGLI